MGNLSGTAATASTHNSAGFPANCAVVQGAVVNLTSVSAPTGGLSGTATLINVAGSCQGSYGGLFPHKYLQRTTGP